MDTKSFKELDLLPSLLNIIEGKGYKNPTPIQEESIPYLIKKRDLLGIAKTGSGKTDAFCLPLVNQFAREPKVMGPNSIRALILSPTRELASQIESIVKEYGTHLELKSKVVFGGVGKIPQIEALDGGLDVLVATPGRLLDLIDNGHINFEHLEVFILDEADMMLDMGFLNDVKRVIAFLPIKKQTLLFSATMPDTIEDLASNILDNPIKVAVDSESSASDTITQIVYTLEKSNKPLLLNSMLENDSYKSILLFCKTKFGADRIIEGLERIPVKCAAIHSNKAQGEREKALKAFRNGEVRVLVATDIAARGIDIKNVSHVINFNLPEDPKSYIHRIGRTGRAGENGVAISFCVPSEVGKLKTIENLIGNQIHVDSDQPFHLEITKEVLNPQNRKSTKKKKSKKRR